MNTRALPAILMRLPTIILALNIFIVSASAQKAFNYEDRNFIYKLTIDSALSPDKVNYECVVKSISIIKKSDNKMIQTILPPENTCFCDMPQDQIFIIEDVNFDTINDIRLLQFLPAAPNLPYYYWTYNAKTKKFQRQKLLEEITSPEFHHDEKIITSFWRSSCCDHGISVYKYINGKPAMIKETEVAQDPDDENKYITTVKQRINGEMKLIKKSVDIDKGDNRD